MDAQSVDLDHARRIFRLRPAPPAEEVHHGLVARPSVARRIGAASGQRLVEKHREAEDVRARVAAELRIRAEVRMEIGRHVVVGALHRAAFGGSLRGGLCLGDLEVDELDSAVFAEEHVGGLDVAVDYPVSGGADQRFEARPHDPERFRGVESQRFPLQPLFKRFAAQEVHHDDVEVLPDAAFLREATPIPDYAGMHRRGKRVGPPLQAAVDFRRIVAADRHRLQGDDLPFLQAGKRPVPVAPGRKYPPLPAFSGELPDDREIADASLGGFGHLPVWIKRPSFGVSHAANQRGRHVDPNVDCLSRIAAACEILRFLVDSRERILAATTVREPRGKGPGVF